MVITANTSFITLYLLIKRLTDTFFKYTSATRGRKPYICHIQLQPKLASRRVSTQDSLPSWICVALTTQLVAGIFPQAVTTWRWTRPKYAMMSACGTPAAKPVRDWGHSSTWMKVSTATSLLLFVLIIAITSVVVVLVIVTTPATIVVINLLLSTSQ